MCSVTGRGGRCRGSCEVKRSAELDPLPGNGLHLGARGLRRVKQGVDVVRFAL